MSADTDVSLSSHDEDQGSKLIQKAKEAPFVPTAMAGFAAITAYGLYKLKSRGNTKIHSCGCPNIINVKLNKLSIMETLYANFGRL
uniref:HIG1 domain-containing protein n=1 Tax=Sus scrofa TaxID=9823 RepID=A0A8D0LIF3_PIG